MVMVEKLTSYRFWDVNDIACQQTLSLKAGFILFKKVTDLDDVQIVDKGIATFII